MSPPARPAPASGLPRRTVLRALAAAPLLGAASAPAATPANEPAPAYRVQRGRIRQSVVPWCFRPWTLEELCRQAVRLGLPSVELVTPDKFPLLKQHGLVCALTGSHGFAKKSIFYLFLVDHSDTGLC